MTDAHDAMINEFVCPGCVVGSDTKCGNYKKNTNTPGAIMCDNHAPGTIVMPGGKIMLGLPVGFNKMRENKVRIRVHTEPPTNFWDHLNVPVWAMVKDDHLFVRTFLPRIADSYVDVIKGGTLELVPNAHDVSKFIDTID